MEAARILADNGSTDIISARNKAAKRLGVTNRRHLPDGRRIESALKEYQALFKGEQQSQALSQLRAAAIRIMRGLHHFSPRLTGAVMEGYADFNTPLEIHLFTERCEDVLIVLMEKADHWRVDERFYRYPDGKRELRPLYRMQEGDVEVELSCFPELELRNRAPLSSVDGKPIRRIGLAEVELLSL